MLPDYSAAQDDNSTAEEESLANTAIFIWHASTLPAADGKFTYNFAMMVFETRGFYNIILQTNGGEARIESLGRAGYNRYASFSVTCPPLEALEIHAARDDTNENLLHRLETDLSKVMMPDFIKGPLPLSVQRSGAAPDPLLLGKTIRVSLSPITPGMQCTGTIGFTLLGEPGLPPVHHVAVYIADQENGRYLDPENDNGEVTSSGQWYAQLGYEAFLPLPELQEASPSLVMPAEQVITQAWGEIGGKKVNLLPSLEAVRFQPLPIRIVR